jgi:hypothetical protein
VLRERLYTLYATPTRCATPNPRKGVSITSAKRSLATIATAFLSSQAAALPNHLAPPAIYDNAKSLFGQTFIAETDIVSGVSWYFGDPTRPGIEVVNELAGVTDLVLFDASNLSGPSEIGRNRVQQAGQQSFGLTTFSFSTPITVVPGRTYFIAVDTEDQYFGLGLRQQNESSYDGGFEAMIDTSGGIAPAGGGPPSNIPGARVRDTSFEILSTPVPEPNGWLMLMLGIAVLAGRAHVAQRTAASQETPSK